MTESVKVKLTRRAFVWQSFLAINSFHLFPMFAETLGDLSRLNLKVYDAETGQITPSSVAIRTSDGELLTQNPGYNRGFRCPGEFRAALPPGTTTITITKGFDFQAQVKQLSLAPGADTECVIYLKRVSPLSREGWVCGDSHVHMLHDYGGFLVDFPYLALSARAEALDYMGVTQYWNVTPATPAVLSKKCAEVSTPDCMLHWNLEAPKNYWRGDDSHCMGHCWTIALPDTLPDGKDPIAELLAMSAWDYETEKPPTPNFESHALIHSVGGLTVYTHPLRFWRGASGGQNGFPIEQDKFISNMGQELPFDTIAGPTYDGIDILMQTGEHLVNELGEQLWFMLLNHGYRLPATASSDATFNNPGRAVPGAVRVYTKVNGALTIDKLAAGLRAGHNFVTSGPLLDFTIDGQGVGTVFPVGSAGKRRGHVRAWASGAPDEHLTKITILRGGELYKSYEVAGNASFYEASFDIEETATTWYVVKCHGLKPEQVATSNPIYFESSDYQPPQPTRASVTCTMKDKVSGEPLNGSYEIVQMVGREPHTLDSGPVVEGKAAFSAPATARIRVKASGYTSQMKSIFMDTPALLGLTIDIQPHQILDWATYEEIRRILGKISLDFALQKA